MKTIFKITSIITNLMVFGAIVDAQQPAKVPHIGFLGGGGAVDSARHEALRQGLRELGYFEGKNIVIEWRIWDGKQNRQCAMAAELARLKVDVIVAIGTGDIRTTKEASATIRIVMVSGGDAVGSGLVSSLARPGGNVTGFYSMADVLAGKRLQLLKESIPKLSRVAVLWYPKSRSSEPQWTESQLAARQLGLQVHSREISNRDNYESAFKEAVKAVSTALAVTRGRLILSSVGMRQIIELAVKYRLPAIADRDDFVDRGGLMSYGSDDEEKYQPVADFIDKILKGAKPADIPVEQPSKFEIVFNLKTAKAIGLNIPLDVLARANRVMR
jgi:putative ABC transport system substrate-binding protein